MEEEEKEEVEVSIVGEKQKRESMEESNIKQFQRCGPNMVRSIKSEQLKTIPSKRAYNKTGL